jgi:hypothetical protein
LNDGRGVRQPCRLEDDLVEPAFLFHQGEDSVQPGIADGAAQAAVVEFEPLFDESVIRLNRDGFGYFDGNMRLSAGFPSRMPLRANCSGLTFDIRRITKLVHDHGYPPTVLFLEDVVEQSALSAAEVARHDRHRDLSLRFHELRAVELDRSQPSPEAVRTQADQSASLGRKWGKAHTSSSSMPASETLRASMCSSSVVILSASERRFPRGGGR